MVIGYLPQICLKVTLKLQFQKKYNKEFDFIFIITDSYFTTMIRPTR